MVIISFNITNIGWVWLIIIKSSDDRVVLIRGAIRIWSIRISDEPSVIMADYGSSGLKKSDDRIAADESLD